MTRLGFQLHSIHAIDDPLAARLARVADTAFEGVEFAGFGEGTPEDAADALAGTTLDAAGMHVDVDDVEGDPGGVAAACRAFDCQHVVVPWLPPARFATREAIAATARRLDDLAATMLGHEVTLHYHNHDHELAAVDGRPALAHLVAESDLVRFQVDLGWVGAAGHDPLAFLESTASRVDVVHLKDYDADRGEPVPVGDGDLDVPRVLDVARDRGLDWVVYEAETAPDTYDTLARADEAATRYW